MPTWESPWALGLLALAPLCAWLLWRARRARVVVVAGLRPWREVAALPARRPDPSREALVAALVPALCAVALAGPRWSRLAENEFVVHAVVDARARMAAREPASDGISAPATRREQAGRILRAIEAAYPGTRPRVYECVDDDGARRRLADTLSLFDDKRVGDGAVVWISDAPPPLSDPRLTVVRVGGRADNAALLSAAVEGGADGPWLRAVVGRFAPDDANPPQRILSLRWTPAPAAIADASASISDRDAVLSSDDESVAVDTRVWQLRLAPGEIRVVRASLPPSAWTRAGSLELFDAPDSGFDISADALDADNIAILPAPAARRFRVARRLDERSRGRLSRALRLVGGWTPAAFDDPVAPSLLCSDDFADFHAGAGSAFEGPAFGDSSRTPSVPALPALWLFDPLKDDSFFPRESRAVSGPALAAGLADIPAMETSAVAEESGGTMPAFWLPASPRLWEALPAPRYRPPTEPWSVDGAVVWARVVAEGRAWPLAMLWNHALPSAASNGHAPRPPDAGGSRADASMARGWRRVGYWGALPEAWTLQPAFAALVAEFAENLVPAARASLPGAAVSDVRVNADPAAAASAFDDMADTARDADGFAAPRLLVIRSMARPEPSADTVAGSRLSRALLAIGAALGLWLALRLRG